MSNGNFTTTRGTEKFLLKAGSLGFSLEKVTELFDHVQAHPHEGKVYDPIECRLKYLSWNGFNILYLENQSQEELLFLDIYEDRDPPPPPNKPSLLVKIAGSFLRYEVMHELGKMIDRLADHWPKSEINMLTYCGIGQQLMELNKASTLDLISTEVNWNLDDDEFWFKDNNDKNFSVIIVEDYETGIYDNNFDKISNKYIFDEVRTSRLAAGSSIKSLSMESYLRAPSWRRPSKLSRKNRTLYKKLWEISFTSRNNKKFKIKEKCGSKQGLTNFLGVTLFSRSRSTLKSLNKIHIESKALRTPDSKFLYLENDLGFRDPCNSKSFSSTVKELYLGKSFERLVGDNNLVNEAAASGKFKFEQYVGSSRLDRKYRIETRNTSMSIPKSYSQNSNLLSWSEKSAKEGGQHEYE
jgi:hypothetical protein